MRHFGWLCFLAACAAMAVCIVTPIAAEAPKLSENVNLELKDTDVKSAIEVLFRNTGKNFSVDQNVTGNISALSIKDVPFDTALKSLTKSAGLVYRVDGGVYIISKKPEVSTVITSTPPPSVDPVVDQVQTEPEIRIEKVSLNNVSATEILSILTGQNRQYGGYGLGNSYGNGYGGGYGMRGGYGGGYNGGMGFGGGYNSGYGGGYGMNSGYGGYGGYNSYGGSRNYGYGGGTYGGGMPVSYGGYGGYNRGW